MLLRSGNSKLKKAREKYFLQHFLRDGKLNAKILSEGEKPDFIVEIDGRKVGVEVTELFASNGGDPSPQQALESVAKEIVSSACQYYQELVNPPPVRVRISFRTGNKLPKNQHNIVARKLADYVYSCASDLTEWGSSNNHSPRDPTGAYFPQVTNISVTRVPSEGTSVWQPNLSGWVAPITPALLQSRMGIIYLTEHT